MQRHNAHVSRENNTHIYTSGQCNPPIQQKVQMLFVVLNMKLFTFCVGTRVVPVPSKLYFCSHYPRYHYPTLSYFNFGWWFLVLNRGQSLTRQRRDWTSPSCTSHCPCELLQGIISIQGYPLTPDHLTRNCRHFFLSMISRPPTTPPPTAPPSALFSKVIGCTIHTNRNVPPQRTRLGGGFDFAPPYLNHPF